jgi:ribosome recycling factor
MDENVVLILESAEELMQKALEHLEHELLKIRAGKANPVMLQSVRVEYYGSLTPLIQLASVSAEDARTLLIKPFDRKEISKIEKAILEANLGFNPQNDGINIRIPIPMLTEERRIKLSKQAKAESENGKISLRNIRRDHIQEIKKLKDEGVSEDMMKTGEGEIDTLIKTYSARVDEILKAKEEEIMTV